MFESYRDNGLNRELRCLSPNFLSPKFLTAEEFVDGRGDFVGIIAHNRDVPNAPSQSPDRSAQIV